MDATKLKQLAISESGFIFDPRTGLSYTVNSTGYSILSLLKDAIPADEVAARLEEEYEVSRPEAERDVIDFMEALKALRLG